MKQSRPVPTELLKGNTKTLVLSILKDGPAHGYAIANEIARRSQSAVNFRQGTLYPLLHELERDGHIVGAWRIIGNMRPRKVYEITESGLGELERGLEAWRSLAQAMYRVTGVRPDEA